MFEERMNTCVVVEVALIYLDRLDWDARTREIASRSSRTVAAVVAEIEKYFKKNELIKINLKEKFRPIDNGNASIAPRRFHCRLNQCPRVGRWIVKLDRV